MPPQRLRRGPTQQARERGETLRKTVTALRKHRDPKALVPGLHQEYRGVVCPEAELQIVHHLIVTSAGCRSCATPTRVGGAWPKCRPALRAMVHDATSTNLNATCPNFDLASQGLNKTMLTSKAFCCTIPGQRDDQLSHLEHWAENHCAQSAIFATTRGAPLLLGLKAEPRASAPCARTIRTCLRRMCIHVPLRGRWCTLITPRGVLALSDAAGGGRRGAGMEEPNSADERFALRWRGRDPRHGALLKCSHTLAPASWGR